MLVLGFWQLDRHDQKKDINKKIDARISQTAVDILELDLDSGEGSILKDQEYRKVTVTGFYKQSDSVLVRNRSFDGSPGYWLLTPLDLGTGEFVIINRGWLPVSAEEFSDTNLKKVTIEGIAMETQTASGLQREDSPEGNLSTLGRVDLDRYQKQLDYEILPIFVQITNQEPKQNTNFPIILNLPKFKDGQHLNYAVQWFIFAAIAAFGYPLVIYRSRNKISGESDIPVDYL